LRTVRRLRTGSFDRLGLRSVSRWPELLDGPIWIGNSSDRGRIRLVATGISTACLWTRSDDLSSRRFVFRRVSRHPGRQPSLRKRACCRWTARQWTGDRLRINQELGLTTRVQANEPHNVACLAELRRPEVADRIRRVRARETERAIVARTVVIRVLIRGVVVMT
jgi:hypothetical protein